MNLKESWIAYLTIIRIEGLRTLRLWTQTLVPPAMTSILYFIIFGHVIGSRIGHFGGFHYATFIAPGLIMMQMITSAYMASVFSFFFAKYNKSIEEILVSPMSNFLVLVSYMSVGMIRGICVGIVVAVVAAIFAKLHFYSIVSIILVSSLATAVFSLFGVINAVYATKFDDISIIPNFVITPLTYFGGVFYSVSMLPHGFREISFFNPIYYIVDGFRYGFLGVNANTYNMSLVVLTLMFMGVFVVALWIFKRGAGLRP